jgi:hypothetical protein
MPPVFDSDRYHAPAGESLSEGVCIIDFIKFLLGTVCKLREDSLDLKNSNALLETLIIYLKNSSNLRYHSPSE